jgi:hypothetical protein
LKINITWWMCWRARSVNWLYLSMRVANTILSGSDIRGGIFTLRCNMRTCYRRIMISKSLSLLATPIIAIRSRDRENNDISSEKIVSLSLRAIVFYKPKSLPLFGKLMQTNEVVTLLETRRLSRMCGWIICTIQAVCGSVTFRLYYVSATA